MLRKGLFLIKYLSSQPLIRQNQLNYKGLRVFSSQNEPPKGFIFQQYVQIGFEKFQRKNKQKEIPQEKQEQTIKKEEKNEEVKQTVEVEEKLKGFEKFQRKQKEIPQEKQEQTIKKKEKNEEVKQTVEEEKPQDSKKKKKLDQKNFDRNQSEQDAKKKKQQKEEELNFDFVDLEKHYIKIIALFGLGGLLLLFYKYEQNQEISYSELIKNYLENGLIKKVIIQRERESMKIVATFYVGDFKRVKLLLGNIDHFLENFERDQLKKGKTIHELIPVQFKSGEDTTKAMELTANLLSLGLSFFIAYILIKSFRQSMGQLKMGGKDDVFGFGKSNVKQFTYEQSAKIKFKDVAGLDEAKNEVKEFVDFLKKPTKYKDIGAKIPRGALLAGPPGTGKTMLAKACAGEAGVPFFYVSGSDFVEMFVGVGASRVRDLFKQAKHKSPSIIFIDEIDAVGRKREVRAGGGNDEKDNTLNQLLVEMDGFGTDVNIVILAATNRKEMLDPALTRPGRFDRTIDINLPDMDGRKEIFKVHLQPLKLDPSKTMDEYARRLATLTPGFSGAEIANLCNEAAILAARKNKTSVHSSDFELAAERVMAGLEKKKAISEEERKIIAYHESGHAVVSWFLAGGNPLLKLTIIPRSKGSLGYAQYLPNESNLETKSELYDKICCILGGRCSENYFFKSITSGAHDDLKKAYETAHAIVTKFGMSENLGYLGYEEGEYQKPYSEKTNKLIDEEIKNIIEECSKKTKELIHKHKDYIEKQQLIIHIFDRLANSLLEKDTLDLEKIIEILGDRPFPPKSNYKAYLELKKIEKEEIPEEETKQEEEVEKNQESNQNSR